MDKGKRQRPNKREAILHYALKVFTHNGFGATTYEMIGEQAGVTRSLIAKYYGSKENLALQAIGVFAQEYARRLAQAAAKEDTYAGFVEQSAKLVKRWRAEIGFMIALSATPAHKHLVVGAWDIITWIPERYLADISPNIVRQMAAVQIAYAVNGDEAAYDAERSYLLALAKDVF